MATLIHLSDKEMKHPYFDINKAKEVLSGADISELTYKTYIYNLPMFFEFAQEPTRDLLLRYKQHLRLCKDGTSVGTWNMRLTAARVYLKRLYVTGLIDEVCWEGAKSFKDKKTGKRIGPSREEVDKMFFSIDKRYNKTNCKRDKALLCLLAYQGLRVSEIAKININDLFLNDGQAMVSCKGKQGKNLIYLHPKTVNAITELIADRLSGPLFLTRHKNAPTRVMVSLWAKKIMQEADIEDKVVHSFRHFFVSSLLEILDGDVASVKEFSRHESIEVLMAYNDNRLQLKQLNKFHKAF